MRKLDCRLIRGRLDATMTHSCPTNKDISSYFPTVLSIYTFVALLCTEIGVRKCILVSFGNFAFQFHIDSRLARHSTSDSGIWLLCLFLVYLSLVVKLYRISVTITGRPIPRLYVSDRRRSCLSINWCCIVGQLSLVMCRRQLLLRLPASKSVAVPPPHSLPLTK